MNNTYIPNVSGFVDFCEYHATTGKPFYIVFGELYASYDLLREISTAYNFTFPNSKKAIENAIQKNLYMFDVIESTDFYYPNTNMFSSDNSIRNIRGFTLFVKDKYRY